MKTIQKLGLGVAGGILLASVGCTVGTAIPCTEDGDCPSDQPVCDDVSSVCVAGDSSDPSGEGEGEPECDDFKDAACLQDRAEGDEAGLCLQGTCGDPNLVTATCNAALPDYAGGPIIIDAEEILSGDPIDDCENVSTYLSVVYSEVAFDSSLNGERLEYMAAGGSTLTNSFSGTETLPSVEALDGEPGYYLLTWYGCESGAGAAVTLNDNDGTQGNSLCLE